MVTLLWKMANRANSTATSTSASLNIINGDFPPNSSVTLFKLLAAAACMIKRPTSVEPVKLTWKQSPPAVNSYYIFRKKNKNELLTLKWLICYLVNVHMWANSSSSSLPKPSNYIQNPVRCACLLKKTEQRKTEQSATSQQVSAMQDTQCKLPSWQGGRSRGQTAASARRAWWPWCSRRRGQGWPWRRTWWRDSSMV